MAIFKAPRVTTAKRSTLVLEASEIVYDIGNKIYYGGDSATLGGFPLGRGSLKTEKITLTQEHIDNKAVVLNAIPVMPSSVTLTPVGGIPQLNGEDFSVIGNILSWDSLGLEDTLIVGDVLLIQY